MGLCDGRRPEVTAVSGLFFIGHRWPDIIDRHSVLSAVELRGTDDVLRALSVGDDQDVSPDSHLCIVLGENVEGMSSSVYVRLG